MHVQQNDALDKLTWATHDLSYVASGSGQVVHVGCVGSLL